jgi:hypothetical protein
MAISKPRNRVVLFRLTQEEFQQVQAACTQSAARSVSDYARARILGVTSTDAAPLAHVDRQIGELSRAVEHLTKLVEAANPPRAEAAAAGGFGPYLAKSGD